MNIGPTGWTCPKCGGVMSPSMPTCFYCRQSTETSDHCLSDMSEQNDRANSRAETAEAEIGRLLAALREWQRWYREEAGYRPRLQLEEMTDRLLGDGAIWEVAGD